MQGLLQEQRAQARVESQCIEELQGKIETLKVEHRSAHKALKGQSRALELELEAANALAVRAEHFVEEQGEVVGELRGQLQRLQDEVVLLKEEKQFALDMLNSNKSETRAKVAEQQRRAAEARTDSTEARKRAKELSAQLQQTLQDRVASRKKFVTLAEGSEEPKDYRRWGDRILQDTLLWAGMTPARILESCRALVVKLEAKVRPEPGPDIEVRSSPYSSCAALCFVFWGGSRKNTPPYTPLDLT